MASAILPNLGLEGGWTPQVGSTPGETGWGEEMNANLQMLDAIIQLSVLSVVAPTPLVTTDGTRYCVPASGATGAFAGHANQVASRVNGAWKFYTPRVGWMAQNQGDNKMYLYNGANWTLFNEEQATLDVSGLGSWLIPTGAGFTKLPLTTVNNDNRAGWNATTFTYTAPESGVYIVEGMVRPVTSGSDDLPAGAWLGLGFGPAPADTIDVVYSSAVGTNPMTVLISKPMRLAQGTAYQLYARHSEGTDVAVLFAHLRLVRVSA